MNIDLTEFDFSNVEPAGFEPIPQGKYVAMITSVEKRETRAGTGHYLSLRFDLIDGKYKGRVIFINLNLWNQNPKAVEMAQRDMAGILRALNIQGPVGDANELCNKAIGVDVTVRHSDFKGGPENGIKSYLPAGKVPVGDPQPAANESSPAPAPWAT